MVDVAPGTIALYSDIGCAWAHAAVSRLHRTRAELGLEEAVRLDHRVFPLELVNRQPTSKPTLDAEVPVVGGIEPDAGWQMWQAPEAEWPVTTLPALEAVQAAKEQGLAASEALDRGLRKAFFAESRCISLLSVILDVAEACPGVDAGVLARALEEGRGRRMVFEQWAVAEGKEVKGSPHLFLPDGTDAHNPGIEMRWEGDHGTGFPVIESDRPEVYAELLGRAA